MDCDDDELAAFLAAPDCSTCGEGHSFQPCPKEQTPISETVPSVRPFFSSLSYLLSHLELRVPSVRGQPRVLWMWTKVLSLPIRIPLLLTT